MYFLSLVVYVLGTVLSKHCREKESESEVAQSCWTLWDPMDCSLPGSSVHGIFQAIVLEWIAISFSRGSRPRVRTQVSLWLYFPTLSSTCPLSLLNAGGWKVAKWRLWWQSYCGLRATTKVHTARERKRENWAKQTGTCRADLLCAPCWILRA